MSGLLISRLMFSKGERLKERAIFYSQRLAACDSPALRNVAARLLRPRRGERSRTARREVPEIRLSGAWLERIGFPKGARYLISVEREFRTIILQGKFEKKRGH